jgi:hypothetical protein
LKKAVKMALLIPRISICPPYLLVEVLFDGIVIVDVDDASLYLGKGSVVHAILLVVLSCVLPWRSVVA